MYSELKNEVKTKKRIVKNFKKRNVKGARRMKGKGKGKRKRKGGKKGEGKNKGKKDWIPGSVWKEKRKWLEKRIVEDLRRSGRMKDEDVKLLEDGDDEDVSEEKENTESGLFAEESSNLVSDIMRSDLGIEVIKDIIYN